MTPESFKEFVEKHAKIKVELEHLKSKNIYSYSFHTKDGRRYGVAIKNKDFKLKEAIIFFAHLVAKDWKILNRYSESSKKVKKVLGFICEK